MKLVNDYAFETKLYQTVLDAVIKSAGEVTSDYSIIKSICIAVVDALVKSEVAKE